MLKEEDDMVTPGEVPGNSTDIKCGKGAYLSRDTNTIYASITGRRSVIPPSSESPGICTFTRHRRKRLMKVIASQIT
nr:exosome complex component CSL4 [Tanacetum cinerariifolium]